MEHEDVIARLRALGKQPVAPVAAAQLGWSSGAAARPRRWPAVAAATLAALTVTTGVVAAVNGTGRPATVGVGDRPDPVPPEGALSCDGPPSSAGEHPSSAPGGRAVEAAELMQWREENCPASTTERTAPAEVLADDEPAATSELAGDSEATTEPGDDPCTGPPPFASAPAEPADPAASAVPSPRSSEAAVLATERHACAAGTTAADATNAPVGVPQGAPARTPGRPPGVPQGPPEETPNGPPADAPQGPPEGTPNGPPADAPQGPPEGTPDPTEVPPIELPVVVPDRGADHAPGGPPDDAPAGRGGQG